MTKDSVNKQPTAPASNGGSRCLDRLVRRIGCRKTEAIRLAQRIPFEPFMRVNVDAYTSIESVNKLLHISFRHERLTGKGTRRRVDKERRSYTASGSRSYKTLATLLLCLPSILSKAAAIYPSNDKLRHGANNQSV